MTKRWFLMTMMWALAAHAGADYVQERAAAVALTRAGNHEAALSAFLALATDAPSPFHKADALEQAALATARLTRFDAALDLAAQIPLATEAALTRMTILDLARRAQPLVDEFGAEDLHQWPDTLAGRAFLARGRAYFSLKQGAAAEADLEQAARYPTDANTLSGIFNLRGDNYRLHLKNPDRAIAMYRRVTTPPGIQWGAAMELARLLSQQDRHDEAIASLGRILEDERVATNAAWHGRLLLGFGDALAAAGRTPQALDAYQRVLRLEGLPDDMKAASEQRIARLGHAAP